MDIVTHAELYLRGAAERPGAMSGTRRIRFYYLLYTQDTLLLSSVDIVTHAELHLRGAAERPGAMSGTHRIHFYHLVYT